MPGDIDSHDQYVLARRVLLDAIEVLQPHIDAIILVGAQAIYLNTGESDENGISPYTTDADISIDPNTLGAEPELIRTMRAAGFERQDQPGIWKSLREGLTVDLLVPVSLGGAGKRGARLVGHGKNAARNVTGLSGALVDRAEKLVTALESTDTRSFTISVAGPMSLAVAKSFKIHDRKGISSREDAKDAYDLFRILREFSTDSLATRFELLRTTPLSQEEALLARIYLAEMFRDASA